MPTGNAHSWANTQPGATIDRDGARNRTRNSRRDPTARPHRPDRVRRRRGPRRRHHTLLDTPAFSTLRETAIFEQVKVDEDTGTIAWPGDVDLDPDVIYAALDLGPDKALIHVLAPA
jgi:hypothetical protein